TLAGVAFSHDDGETWAQGAGMAMPTVNGIAADGADLYAAMAHGWRSGESVYKSADGGVTWTSVSPASETMWRVIAHGGYVFAGSRGAGVFRSGDGGTTWIATNSGLVGDALTTDSMLSTPSRLFLGARDGLYYSDDAGISWTLTAAISGSGVAALHDSGAVLYAAKGATLFTSTDGGDFGLRQPAPPAA
ncbi:MAG: sialidase family protein, partial [Candidatus Poribacteria bacterium]